MNKRITSILLSLVMVFSILATAVPVYATTYESTALKVTPDKTSAYPGDTITYSIIMGPVSDMGSMQMVLDIPTGLTYVEKSGQLADGLKNTLGFDAADWTEASIRTDPLYPGSMINGYASAADYECSTDTVLATFQCTVDDGFTGTVSVGLVKLEFGSCQTFEYHTDRFSVEPTAVTVEARPVAVTGVTVDETMSLNIGDSKTLTVTIAPAEATNKTVAYSITSGSDVVTVDANGKVTGVKKGTAVVKVTTQDGSFSDTCTVTVACPHTNKTATSEKASDCKTNGWDAYSECDECGQLFDASVAEIAEIPYRPLSNQHTGGSASCTAQAVCTVCLQPYGDKLAHNFTKEEKKAEALKTAGDCGKEAVYIKSCTACGLVDTDTNNTFNGEKDANNHANYGTYLDNPSEPDHKNGVDGYTGDKRCNSCKVIREQGQPIPAGAHVPADVWSTDPDYHWKECNVTGCGVVIDGSKAEHKSEKTENKAACGKQAVCDVCGVGYGAIPQHDFTDEVIKDDALKAEGDCGKEALYIKSCTVCGQVDSDTDNLFRGDRDAANHADYGTYLDGYEAADHKNQIDGYTGDDRCNSCDEIINEGQPIPAGAHTPAEDWSTDDDSHWKECTVTDCGVIIDGSDEPHISDKAENKAACEKQAVCDICGVGYGEIPEHNYGEEIEEEPAEIGKDGLKAHYQCSECNKYFVDVEHDTHVEKKEVEYAELIIPALIDEELTIEIPFDVIVEKTGELDPAAESFTFKMYDLGYADTVYTVTGLTVDTDGVGTYNGKLVIKVKESQFGNLSEGFKFAQVKGSADGWTYDETVYYIAPTVSDTGVTSFVIFPGEDGWGNTTLENVEFTNSYYAEAPAGDEDSDIIPGGDEDEDSDIIPGGDDNGSDIIPGGDDNDSAVTPDNNQPEDDKEPAVTPDNNQPEDDSDSAVTPDAPQTGDDNLIWLWTALLIVSVCGVVAVTIIRKKRESAK